MDELKDLLIVRLGKNSLIEDHKIISDFYNDKIKSHIVIVIFGENDSIETKFETVYLK